MIKTALNTILNNLPQAIIIMDRNDSVIYVNDGFETMFGYNIKELTGKNIFSLLFLNNSQDMIEEYKKIIPYKHVTFTPGILINNSQQQTICVELTIKNLLHDKNIQGILITATNMDNIICNNKFQAFT